MFLFWNINSLILSKEKLLNVRMYSVVNSRIFTGIETRDNIYVSTGLLCISRLSRFLNKEEKVP